MGQRNGEGWRTKQDLRSILRLKVTQTQSGRSHASHLEYQQYEVTPPTPPTFQEQLRKRGA